MGGPPQALPYDRPQGAQGNQRTPYIPPLSVELLNTGKSEAEAAAEAKDQENKAANDRLMIGLTGALAVAAMLQWGVILWQAILTRRAIRDGEKAANAATLSAQASVNAERPFVFISDLEIERLAIPPQEDGIDRGDVYTITYVFTNYGRTPAFVRQIGFGFIVGAEPPPTPEYRAVRDFSIEIVIRPERTHRFTPGTALVVTPEQRADFGRSVVSAWLWGRIQFQDFFGGTGETGFIGFHQPAIIVSGTVLREAGFGLSGPAAYTYQHYTQGQSA